MFMIYLTVVAAVVSACNVFLFDGLIAGSLLRWLLVFPVGCGSMWAFLGHYFKSDEVAGYIGWPAGNPFQKEVAFANLAVGTCGLLSVFLDDGFRLATIVFVSVFLIGAFLVHTGEQKRSGNFKPGNAGPIYFTDLGIPLVLWVLHFLA